MAAHDAHRLPGRGAHGRHAEALRELAENPFRRLARLDDARRDAERPGGGVDQEGVRAGLVVGEIALAELVLDEPVRGRGIGHAQERLGQDHEGEPLLGRQRIFPQHLLDAAEPGAVGTDRLDEIARPRVDAPLALLRQPRPVQKAGGDRRIVFGIRGVEARDWRHGGLRSGLGPQAMRIRSAFRSRWRMAAG